MLAGENADEEVGVLAYSNGIFECVGDALEPFGELSCGNMPELAFRCSNGENPLCGVDGDVADVGVVETAIGCERWRCACG